VAPQRPDHVDPFEQVIIDGDPDRSDLLDQAVGRGGLDVGDEDDPEPSPSSG
jgi:hypothetical protein